MNQKIDQLKNIYGLYPKSKLDTSKFLRTINDIEEEVLGYRPITTKISNIYGGILENKLSIEQWIFIKRIFSGTILFLIMSFIFPFTNKGELKNIYIGIWVIAIFVNVVLLMVPTFDNLTYNHLINVGATLLLLIGMGIYGNKSKS